jgi:hypothetical protein
MSVTKTQYTIRSVPKKLDLFLRRQARLHDKSLNQILLDYLNQAVMLDMQAEADDFSWIIGANTIDPKSLQAIKKLKAIDKTKQRRQ